MRKLANYILLLLVLVLAGCSQDYNEFATGYGDLQLEVTVDSSIRNIAGAEAVSVAAPELDDIGIEAVGENGNRRSWKNVDEFRAGQTLVPVDSYEFTASSGDSNQEGFVSPVFAATCNASIMDSRLTTVQLPCRVASALLSVSVSGMPEGVRSMAFRFKSETGQYVDFKDNETRFACLHPGKIKGELVLTDNQNRAVVLQPVEITDAHAAEHYQLRCSTASTDEAAKLQLAYDEVTVASPKEVVINEELFSTPSPQFSFSGFEQGTPVAIYENSTPAGPVVCKVEAASGLKHLYLTVVSESYLDNPFSKETDLVGLSENSAVECGIVMANVADGATEATIDLSNLISRLPAGADGAATHTIVLQAEDANGRLAPVPASISVITTPIALSIAAPEKIGIDDETAKITVTYNGDNFDEDVDFEYTELGMDDWQPMVIVASKKIAESTYELTVEAPYGKQSVYIRASYKGGLRYSEKVLLMRNLPEFNVVCNNENIWTSKADLLISGTDASKIIDYLSVYIREAGGNWHPAVVEKSPEEQRITVSTLMPSTSYDIVVATSEIRRSLQITTEQALDLPNGSFEDNITETISIDKINCGGRYSNVSSWMPTYNVTSIKVRETKDWASVNAKTCSEFAKTSNTWFKVPTTEIVSQSYDGVSAVRLRNAAWDINGVEPPRDVRTDNGYYSRNVPTIANRSAGKLFLGSYSFDSNGNEHYTKGISFTSRPTSIQGYYRYVQDVHDHDETGLVQIQVVSDADGSETVIGEGVGYLNASTSYTLFTVPIKYKVRNKQATRLKLMISSSNYASYTQLEETRRIKTTDYLENGISTGAELIVDNLKLLYE